MSFRALPPDRDPELRNALALDVDDQCALLARLAGECQPCERFEPLPPRVHRTAKGSLVCSPAARPLSAVMASDSRTLSISIEHGALDRRSMPRSREAVADLQAAIDAHAAKVGIVTVPFARPSTWTVSKIREVIGLMVKHLPRAAGDSGAYCVRVTQAAGFIEVDEIQTWAYSRADRHGLVDRSFSAIVRLRPGAAADAITAWRRIFPTYWGGGPLDAVDQQLAGASVSAPGAFRTAVSNRRDEDEPAHGVEMCADLLRLRERRPAAAGLVHDLIVDYLENP